MESTFSNALLEKFKRYKYLIFLVIFHILFFILFQTIDKAAQTWDSAGHINTSMRIADEFKDLMARKEGVSLISILKVSNYYPPLIPTLGAFVNLIFGYSSEMLLYFGLLFFLVTIIYTYKIVYVLTGNEKLALLSTAVYSLFPQVVDQARLFHLDIPLVAFLEVSFYYLWLSNGFEKTKYVVLFFLFFAFAQLCKWYGFVFLTIPVIYVLWVGFRKEEKIQRLLNVVMGSALFLLIATPWYIVNSTDLFSFAGIFSTGEVDDPQVLLSIQNFFYYPLNIMVYNLLFVPSIFLFGSFIYLIKTKRKEGIFALLFVLLPFFVFTFIGNKNIRYLLPLAPLFGYVISYGILSLRDKFKWIGYFVLIYMFSGLMFLTFNQVQRHTPISKLFSILYTGPAYSSWYNNSTYFYSYSPNYWPIEEMLKFIVQNANKPPSVPLGISPLIDAENFSAATIEMIRLENHLDNVYFPVPYFQFEAFPSDWELMQFFTENGVEYVIAPQDPGPQGLRNYAALKQMVDFLRSDRNIFFDEINKYTMPDGLEIRIYKRRGLEQSFIKTGECTQKSGFVDGIESIKLEPDTTYVFFTGHFAIQDKILRNYEQGTLYIIQVENTIHESILDVHNLPKAGSGLCSRKGIGLSVEEEIKNAVESADGCGPWTPCNKVVHVKWSVGDEDVELIEYNR